MIDPISKERWFLAQQSERRCHALDFKEGFAHYREAYQNIFRYLGMETDQHSKIILEIGPADFPALAYCSNYQGIIIEPMMSDHLVQFCGLNEIELITTPAEETNLPDVDEVWLFNLLQHVIDPDLLIAKCKAASDVVRFFEPVDYPTCVYHPHTFSQDDFARWFDGCVQRYTDRLARFFDNDCCYGTWEKPKCLIS